MNLDKSKKRIEKRVKRGFQGYPMVTITYYGDNESKATEVVVGFIQEEGSAALEEKFVTEGEIREDTTVQTTIIKIIDRVEAKSVSLNEGVVCR
jgi:hypothetical protein